MEKEKIKRIVDIAGFAGGIMLENGAETYRVEDIINRICKSKGIQEIHNFTVPTGIFIACDHEGENYSTIIRTKVVDIDLEIITMINSFSREFVSTDMDLEEAQQKLQIIKSTLHYKTSTVCFAGGMAGGFFTLMFGGSFVEFILAFITSFIAVWTVKYFRKHIHSFFVINVLGGAASMLCALILTHVVGNFYEGIDIAEIVIGAMMPLVPGVAMTNALRDSISGDTISGAAKLLEALIVATAIAIGVGTVLQFQLLITGGVL